MAKTSQGRAVKLLQQVQVVHEKVSERLEVHYVADRCAGVRTAFQYPFYPDSTLVSARMIP
jgi:hypothetical protein